MYPFEAGCTHILAGQSGSGKSTYIYNILKHQDDMFGENPPKMIKYYYGIYQPMFDDMKSTIPNIAFIQGLPTHEDLEGFTDPSFHTVIVLDDLMELAKDSVLVQDIITKISHHRFCTCFLLLQNLYAQGKTMRSISLNAKMYHNLQKSQRCIPTTDLGSSVVSTDSKCNCRVIHGLFVA